MKIRVESIVGLVFLLCGMGIMGLGHMIDKNNKEFAETAVPVTAVISEIESYRDSDGDRHHRTYVTYEFDGKMYENVSLGYYSSGMYIGKQEDILCNPDAPHEIQSPKGNKFGFWISLIMGNVFAIVGGGLFLAPIIKTTKKNKIMQDGKTIWGTVEKSEINTHYSVNGDHPWVLYCRYEDSFANKTYRFKSDNLWFDPSFIYNEGDSIQIIVDPNDYSKYRVVVDASKMGEIIDYT